MAKEENGGDQIDGESTPWQTHACMVQMLSGRVGPDLVYFEKDLSLARKLPSNPVDNSKPLKAAILFWATVKGDCFAQLQSTNLSSVSSSLAVCVVFGCDWTVGSFLYCPRPFQSRPLA